ncbi:MAG: hypothetical protein RL684_856 [Pseudomonadota bacterium]
MIPKLLSLLLLPAILAFGTPTTQAQGIAVQFVTPDQGSCTATTNLDGLRWDSASNAYSAAGVVISPGCDRSGAFATTISAPPTALIGVPTLITWSTTSASSICTFATPTSGIDGWPAGQTACSGPACAGSHSTLVTPRAAGVYQFAITCTNATGFASAGLQVSR